MIDLRTSPLSTLVVSSFAWFTSYLRLHLTCSLFGVFLGFNAANTLSRMINSRCHCRKLGRAFRFVAVRLTHSLFF